MGLACESQFVPFLPQIFDGPGVLHHIMARGIERSKISRDNTGRNDFLGRLGGIVSETETVSFGRTIIRYVTELDSGLVRFCSLTS